MDIDCDNLLGLKYHEIIGGPFAGNKAHGRLSTNHLAFSEHQGMKTPLTEEQEEAAFITVKAACLGDLDSYGCTQRERKVYSKAVWAPGYQLGCS